MGYLVDIDTTVVCLLLVVTVPALCQKERDSQEDNLSHYNFRWIISNISLDLILTGNVPHIVRCDSPCPPSGITCYYCKRKTLYSTDSKTSDSFHI